MSKHTPGPTPGPWSIHTEYEAPYRHVVMNDELQQRVCLVPQYEDVDHIANARLVAASLDLLEALQNFLGAFDNPVYRRKLAADPFYAEVITAGRAAIKRATEG